MTSPLDPPLVSPLRPRIPGAPQRAPAGERMTSPATCDWHPHRDHGSRAPCNAPPPESDRESWAPCNAPPPESA